MILIRFQNTESKDAQWVRTLHDLRTADDVFKAMAELNVTNDAVLDKVFGKDTVKALRPMGIAEATEHVLKRSP